MWRPNQGMRVYRTWSSRRLCRYRRLSRREKLRRARAALKRLRSSRAPHPLAPYPPPPSPFFPLLASTARLSAPSILRDSSS